MEETRSVKAGYTFSRWFKKLKKGNKKFVSTQNTGILKPGKFIPGKDLAHGQAPKIGILACADSRVPPSWVFNAAPGELFVVRTAGNVCFEQAIASFEFGVSALGVQVIVVLGHSDCGAVVASLGNGVGLTPSLKSMRKKIRNNIGPSVSADMPIPYATKKNAEGVAKKLTKKSKLLKRAVKDGQLKIRPAYFDIGSSIMHYI